MAKSNIASREEVLEAISKMSVMDLVELISEMEEKFDVSASAPAAVAATGTLYREYFAPRGFPLVYSMPISFNKSNIPNTKASIRLLDEAIS